MTLQTDAPDDALDPAVADYLLGVLLSALPPAADEAADSARRDAVRIAFQSMQPRNPKEAMLAAEAIRLAMFSCRASWLLVGLLAVCVVPPYFELLNRRRPTNLDLLILPKAIFPVEFVVGGLSYSQQSSADCRRFR